MGQKVNPNILRLGVSKKWKTEFFEKKPKEFSYFTFLDLEIKTYIEKFLKNHGLIVHDYKIHYNNSAVNIFISYAITSDVKSNSLKKQQKLKTINNKQKTLTKLNKKNFKKQHNLLCLKTTNSYNIKKTYLKKSIHNSELIKLQKDNIKIKNTVKNFIKGLKLFKNINNTIFLNFECINKNFNLDLKQKKSIKKKIMALQKFKSASFFKEGVNIMFLVIIKQNSAKLLSKFIALELKKIKRHKFFMTFLKKTLSIFLQSSFSKVLGIKIIIKGRLNGAPRAKHKIINIGSIPTQTINSNVDYSESNIHNSNGSYGIKVQIVYKKF